MQQRTFSIFDGSTFVASDGLGDIDPERIGPYGFFSDDTRYLSCWRLTLGGEPLDSLTVADMEYFAVEFFLTRPSRSIYDNPYLSVIRRRLVRGTWVEELLVINHLGTPAEIEMRIDADTDFADLFEVKDALVRERAIDRSAHAGELSFTYRRGGFLRSVVISAPDGWDADEGGFSARLTLGPHEQRRMTFHVRAHAEQPGTHYPRRTPAGAFEATRAEMRRELELWLADAPALETDWDALRTMYRRSLEDLAALRFYPELVPGASLPAAGLPWFMALFGRDSLIASYQTLPMQPDLARTTLRALAASQAESIDDFRDAEPGKILHELRYGELTAFGERPHSPYYGSADATPLFLVLLDEYERWTGDRDLVGALEPNARAALAWIDEHGDGDGDGYVEYRRRNEATGLENQCWKDSWNAILFADGTLAEPPIATCEIQGYVYDAKRRCARLAAEVWHDPELADDLERQAADLKRRFHDDFWLGEHGYYALALDRDKRKVDSLTSNIGHLLWSGIIDPGPAESVVRHLMGTRLFSGWGVRTMAQGDAGYNPIEYHNGTVWPHDNSLAALGLCMYGYRSEATAIAGALIEAAGPFSGCLPEVFAGYERDLTQYPVEYPTASRPQAWAAGAPLLLVRALLELEPGEPSREVALPPPIGRLALTDVRQPAARPATRDADLRAARRGLSPRA
jgi:glycogen debranching enzyme